MGLRRHVDAPTRSENLQGSSKGFRDVKFVMLSAWVLGGEALVAMGPAIVP